MSSFTPAIVSQRRSVGLEALTLLRGRLVGGQWGPGERLPAEEELARELRVSPAPCGTHSNNLNAKAFLRGRGRGRIVVPAMQNRATRAF